MQYDVVIVGAGLSGLNCALTLQEHKLSFIPQGHKFRLSRQAAQLSFIVLESGERPGGKIQTDLKDSFQLDPRVFNGPCSQSGKPQRLS